MNWEVKGVTTFSAIKESMADGVCEHLSFGDRCHYAGEQDSFGPVTRYYYCSDCFQKVQEEEGEELSCCEDCGREFKVKDLLSWKPWDFDPRDGSEPRNVCIECQGLERHQDRVKRDKADLERERDWLDSDD